MSSVSSHVAILREGPDAWNAWRLKHPSAIPNLTGIALDQSERQLGPAQGCPINLRWALLRDAVLRFVELTGADLVAADLSGADLAHARLDKADLRNADLGKSCLDYSSLEDANLAKLSLREASLRFARLSAANLEGSDLSGANLTHARLDQADLKSANLSNARLDYADFAGANLAKVDLRGANLENAKNLSPTQLEKSIGDDSTILPAQLQGLVSWSRGPGETGTHVYRDLPQAPQWAAQTDHATSRSYRRTISVAVSTVIVASAITAGWQYVPVNEQLLALLRKTGVTGKLLQLTQSFSDRIRLPSASDAPRAPPPAEIPVRNAPPIDRPDNILLAQQPLPKNLRPPWGAPPVLVETSGPAHRIEMTELRPVLTEIKAIISGHTRGLVDLPLDGAGRDVVSLKPVSAPPQGAMASASSHATFVRWLVPPSAGLVTDIPAVRLLAPSISLFSETQQPPATTSLPFIAKRRNVLFALSPSAKIAVASIKVQGGARHQNASAPARGDPLILSVSLDRQMIDVFRGASLVMSSRVSSGMPGHETKTGVFSILEKQRFHHSNIYSGAPMPWMQRLTRSGTALHAGMVPGYPASHGCVRLPFSFAPKLFQMTAVGETVMIAGDRMTPKPIEHPKLFQPHPRTMALAMAEGAPQPWRRADGFAESQADIAMLPLVIAKDAEAASDAAEIPSADDNDALAPAPLRILVTRRTPRDQLIGLQYALSSMGYLARQNFDGTFGKVTMAAIRAFQTANGLTETGALNDDVVKKIYEVAGKPLPPEGQLFVRQGFSRVFDTPIAFRQPNQPLGTHVYTAMNFSPKDNKVRWVAFSLEGGDPASVLDRLEVPEDARRMISEALTPGSSLIVADTSVDSAILPDGDDFLVWANESSASESLANDPSVKEPAKAQPSSLRQANLKQTTVDPAKPKHVAHNRASGSPREVRSRPGKRYTANRPPRFEPPRWFSPW